MMSDIRALAPLNLKAITVREIILVNTVNIVIMEDMSDMLIWPFNCRKKIQYSGKASDALPVEFARLDSRFWQALSPPFGPK